MPFDFKCISEGRLENCHLKRRFKMAEDNSIMMLILAFASTTSQCAEACSNYLGCTGFSFQPLSEFEKCKLYSESVFTKSESRTAVVGWCPKGK